MTNPQDEQLAPVYRYFTADLLTNQILAEIPFQGVSYERALKSAGRFSGNIPVIPDTATLDLYDTTIPGKTALYVVRNGVCVWGGIIWSRNYNVVSKLLAVSASEFPSYLYHRLIWKTWNHQFGCTIVTDGVDTLQKSKLIDRLQSSPLDTSFWYSEVFAGDIANLFPSVTADSEKLTIRFNDRAQYAEAGAIRSLDSASLPFKNSAYSTRIENLDESESVFAEGHLYVYLGPPENTLDSVKLYTILYKNSNTDTPKWRAKAYISIHNGTNYVGQPSGTQTISLDSALQAQYLRIREDSGIFYWEYSADGVTWGQIHSFTHSVSNTSLGKSWFYVASYAGDTPNVYPSVVSFSELTYWETYSKVSSEVKLDNGSTSALAAGSAVDLEFFDFDNFKHNGFYKVAADPPPSTDQFHVDRAGAYATSKSFIVKNGVAKFFFEEQVEFKDGDVVRIFGAGRDIDGLKTVISPAKAGEKSFSIETTAPDLPLTDLAATVIRDLPEGVYPDTTLTVRADTYSFVRNLVDAVGKDFVGIDFPNAYIEPGISQNFDIISTELGGGYATIETSEEHNLAIGQAVQIFNLGTIYDGEFVVTDVPTPTSFRYERGGLEAFSVRAPIARTISSFQASNGVVTATTSAAHGYLVGQIVDVNLGDKYSTLSGPVTITEIPGTSRFRYVTFDTTSHPTTTLTAATSTVSGNTFNVSSTSLAGNVARITTETDHSFVVGNSVTLANVSRKLKIIEKSLNAPAGVATITTDRPHNIENGTSVVISGLKDWSSIVKKESTSGASAVVKFTTDQRHNFIVGDVVNIREDMLDVYNITNKAIASNVATITTSTNHNIAVGSTVNIDNLDDVYSISSVRLTNNVATITTGASHNIQVNDPVTVAAVRERANISSVEIVDDIAIITTTLPHNFIEQQEISVSSEVGAPYAGTFTVLSVTDTRILYQIEGAGSSAPKLATGVVVSAESVFNGTYIVSARTSTTFSYIRVAQDQFPTSATVATASASAPSILRGRYTVASVPTGTTFTFAKTASNMTSVAVPAADEDGELQAVVFQESIHNGNRTITAITANTFSFVQNVTRAISPVACSGNAAQTSIFNGTKTVTSVSDDTFTFALTGKLGNVLETEVNYEAYVTTSTPYSGTYTITSVPDSRSFTFARTHVNVPVESVEGAGSAILSPNAIVSTFGPYPGAANIGIGYSTRKYSGVRVKPRLYRGFELVSVGEALEEYADNINGFEYRIDCAYDPTTSSFTKTLVLIPINFPNEPADGEVAPISRYGADKLVFEYPGNISEINIDETAENAATRFFAIGENDLGPDAGPPFSVAASDEFLSGKNKDVDFRKWPLLDEKEQVDGVDDEVVLYAYAQRYLSESRPPDANLTVSVNGSLDPVVGTYAPGDWCSIVVDDDFMRMRLANGLEPREDIIIRKINSVAVSVPDGVTFPEQVSLELVPEWEVDKRGEQAI